MENTLSVKLFQSSEKLPGKLPDEVWFKFSIVVNSASREVLHNKKILAFELVDFMKWNYTFEIELVHFDYWEYAANSFDSIELLVDYAASEEDLKKQ